MLNAFMSCCWWKQHEEISNCALIQLHAAFKDNILLICLKSIVCVKAHFMT